MITESQPTPVMPLETRLKMAVVWIVQTIVIVGVVGFPILFWLFFVTPNMNPSPEPPATVTWLVLALTIRGIGWGQETLLGRFIRQPKGWGTALASGVFLAIGFVRWLVTYAGEGDPFPELPYPLGPLVAGAMIGLLLSGLQTLVLRRYSCRAWCWPLAMMIAGAAALLGTMLVDDLAIIVVFCLPYLLASGLVWLVLPLSATPQRESPRSQMFLPWLWRGLTVVVVAWALVRDSDAARTIPNYPGAQDAIKHEDPRSLDKEVTFWTTDSPNQVLLFYRNRLERQGFDYASSEIGPDGTFRSISLDFSSRCGGPSVTIRVERIGDRTNVEWRSEVFFCY